MKGKISGKFAKGTSTLGLSAGLVLQAGVLITEYIRSVWPLWYGTPVILKTEPVDPRSLFRGNYAKLNYTISTIDKSLARESLRQGEIAYVTLQEVNGEWTAISVSRYRPDTGKLIRGRIVTEIADKYQLRYGIEAYFLPLEKAKILEQWVTRGVHAEVYLLTSGKGALANIRCGEYSCYDPPPAAGQE